MCAVRYVFTIVLCFVFFFFNDTATTEIYTLSLHDALPISPRNLPSCTPSTLRSVTTPWKEYMRSEEHTSELQSRRDLVCRLLLEQKNYTRVTSQSSVRSPELLGHVGGSAE